MAVKVSKKGAAGLLKSMASKALSKPQKSTNQPPDEAEIAEMYGMMLDCFKLGLTDDQIRQVFLEKRNKRSALIAKFDYENQRAYDEMYKALVYEPEENRELYEQSTYMFSLASCEDILNSLEGNGSDLTAERKRQLVAQLIAKYGKAIEGIVGRINEATLTEGQLSLLSELAQTSARQPESVQHTRVRG